MFNAYILPCHISKNLLIRRSKLKTNSRVPGWLWNCHETVEMHGLIYLVIDWVWSYLQSKTKHYNNRCLRWRHFLCVVSIYIKYKSMFCFGNATTSRYAPNKIIDQNSVLQFFKNHLAFQPFEFERTWWRLFQKRVVPNIYVFITFSVIVRIHTSLIFLKITFFTILIWKYSKTCIKRSPLGQKQVISWWLLRRGSIHK